MICYYRPPVIASSRRCIMGIRGVGERDCVSARSPGMTVTCNNPTMWQ